MKRLIIIYFLFFIALCSFGQIYVNPSIGYTFSSHPYEIQSLLVVDNQATIYKGKLKYGEGTHFAMNLGYFIKNNFFVEFNITKSIYTKYKISIKETNIQTLDNFFISGYFGEIDYESSLIQLSPLIGYQVYKNKFGSFLKLGPNFMKSTICHTLNYTDWELQDGGEFYPSNTVINNEYTGKINIGLQANIGVNYSLKQNIQISFEFVTAYNNYVITKAEIKDYMIDGINQLDELDDTNIEIDESDNKLNHSYYGLFIGLKYIFRNNE